MGIPGFQHIFLSNFDKCINFYLLQESNKGIEHRPQLSMPIMENRSLLFTSCHLEPVTSENSSQFFACYIGSPLKLFFTFLPQTL